MTYIDNNILIFETLVASVASVMRCRCANNSFWSSPSRPTYITRTGRPSVADSNSPPPSSAPDIQQILASGKRVFSPSGVLDESVVGQLLSATRAAAVGQSALLAGQRATQLLANANAAILLSKHRNLAAAVAAASASSSPTEQAPPVVTTPLPMGLPSVPPPPPHALPLPPQPPSHGTSAGFCTICKKFVSNRTNHKYVHSQVGGVPLLGVV